MLSRSLAIGMNVDAFWGVSLRAVMLLWERSVGAGPADVHESLRCVGRATHNVAELPM